MEHPYADNRYGNNPDHLSASVLQQQILIILMVVAVYQKACCVTKPH